MSLVHRAVLSLHSRKTTEMRITYLDVTSVQSGKTKSRTKLRRRKRTSALSVSETQLSRKLRKFPLAFWVKVIMCCWRAEGEGGGHMHCRQFIRVDISLTWFIACQTDCWRLPTNGNKGWGGVDAIVTGGSKQRRLVAGKSTYLSSLTLITTSTLGTMSAILIASVHPSILLTRTGFLTPPCLPLGLISAAILCWYHVTGTASSSCACSESYLQLSTEAETRFDCCCLVYSDYARIQTFFFQK